MTFLKFKLATNYTALLRKMTFLDEASYESSPPCTRETTILQHKISLPEGMLYYTLTLAKSASSVRESIRRERHTCTHIHEQNLARKVVLLQCTATHLHFKRCGLNEGRFTYTQTRTRTRTHIQGLERSVLSLQHTATHCNTLQHINTCKECIFFLVLADFLMGTVPLYRVSSTGLR